MPHHRTTIPTPQLGAPATMRAFTETRTALTSGPALTGGPGSDPQQEPAPFEAWVTNLPRTPSAPSASTSAGLGHALSLQGLLRRRAKLARSLFIAATIGLPLVLMLHAAAVSSSPQVLPSVSRSRALAPWLTGHRSPGAAAGTLDIQPARMDGDVVYGCWVDAPPGLGVHGHAPTPLHLAVSVDGAYTWRTLSTPVPRATACHLVPDAVDAQRIALVTQLDAGSAAGCPRRQLFASSDGGMHWFAVTLPEMLAGVCALSLSSASGTLVLWSNGAPTATGVTADAQIWISLDSGATWHAAGAGLPGGIVGNLVSAHPDGALLVLMRRPKAGVRTTTTTTTTTQATSELWSCPAGCPRWQRVAVVPGSTPAVFAAPSEWLPPEGGWGTLYAADIAPAAVGPEQTPTVPISTTTAIAAPIYIRTGTQAGAWHLVPPSPWLAAETGKPVEPSGLSRIVGVGPNGELVLESQNEAVALEPVSAAQEQSAAGVLSAWDPRDGRWLTPVLVEPAATTVLAVIWDEQGANGARRLTIWFRTRSGDLWTMVVPNSDWQVAQMAPRCQRCQ
jgi:hypothetical protein